MWIFCIQKGEILSNYKGSARWKFVVLFSIFALVVVACGGDAVEEDAVDEAAPETTEAPATTAAEVEEASSAPEGAFKLGIFSDPQSFNIWDALDVQQDFWTYATLSPQGTSLFSTNYPTYTLTTNLASELVEVSEDNGDGTFSYTVPLHEGLEWSDGEAIDANDMVFTYETVRDLGMLGAWLSSYPLATEGEDGSVSQGLTNIEAIDDYTVKITFNFDPGLSIWQYGVASSSIVAEHYWSQFTADRETLLAAPGDGAPVAGAFEYGTLESGAFYTWAYDEDTMWFGGDNTVYANGGVSYNLDNGVAPKISYEFGDLSGDSISWTDGPNVGTVEFSLYGDQDAAYLAFQNGEVDFVINPLGLKKNAVESLISAGDIEVITNQSNGYRYMAFNTREGKFPTDNKAFRQAVSCIIDKQFVIDSVLAGAVLNMDGQMPPALTSWVAPVTGVLAECDGLSSEERWNKSIGILQDAGWQADDWGEHPGGAERAIAPTGLKGPNGETMPSDMLLYAPGPGYDPIRSTFSLFAADWMQQLGVDVIARPTGFSVIVDIILGEETCDEWYFYMLGWGLTPYPDHIVDFFQSDGDACVGGINTPGYNNPEYDALAEEFNAAKSVAEAQVIANKMEAILFDDLPYLVLFTPPIIEAYRGNVEFPFTDVLAGISNLYGLPGSVKVND